jgi:hypothetical protein
MQAIEDGLRQQLEVRVEFRVRGKDYGQIAFFFNSHGGAERLLAALLK